MSKVTGITCLYNASTVEIPFSEKANVDVGDRVVFKNEDGKEEFGLIAYKEGKPSKDAVSIPGSLILRKATPNDVQRVESHAVQATQAMETCKQLVSKHEIEMFIFQAGVSFDGTKAYFMFTADDRVDFRELVKDLAKVLKKQIHLRQIGPRDKAKLIGGFGKCGRSLCCNSFLDKLESINMDMVREQGLESKGSSKLSGVCGKLLCCLKYEVESYKDLKKGLPQIGSKVVLKKGSAYPGKEAYVAALDILNQKVRVQFDEREGDTVHVDDIDKKL